MILTLKRIPKTDLKKLWSMSYREKSPKWVEYDAPFLHDYHALSWKEFKQEQQPFFQSKEVQGIYLANKLIGAVNYHWQNTENDLLEVGIVIFEHQYWSQGYGGQALKAWTTKLFSQMMSINQISLITWSGNKGMIRLGEKVGYQIVSRLKKIHYYEGKYYDAIYMRILRAELIVLHK